MFFDLQKCGCMYYEGPIDDMPQQLGSALIRAESLHQWPCYQADSDGGQA